MWWGCRAQSFNIAPQKEEPEMGLSGLKSVQGHGMPEPGTHLPGTCVVSGCLPVSLFAMSLSCDCVNASYELGEQVLARAPGLRKGLEPELPGVLICTNFRVIFQPYGWQRGQDTPLSSEYAFSLVNIGQLEAVRGPSRVQLLHPGSLLKFIPEEILIHGRDFRLLRVGFETGGLEPQAFQVAVAIVRAQAQNSQGRQYPGPSPSQAGQSSQKPVPLLETAEDWETEREKLRASSWRVSAVNERFDVATSLPQYFWVPKRILDSEVRRAFGHFCDGRGPRLSWHHPGGSDLLRCGGFCSASDPNKDDVRAVEAMLQAGHTDVVLVDTVDELPSLADVHLAHLQLRSLCLPESSVAEKKWLSALEGTRWLDLVRSCLRKASDISVLVTVRVRSVVLQERSDRDFNGLLSSLVQLLLAPEARTLLGFQTLVQREWVVAGHPFLTRLGGNAASGEAPVFLLFLDCVWQLLQQFPAEFEFSEFFLLALHDSVRVPDTLTFLRDTPWERGKHSGQFNSYTPVYTPGYAQFPAGISGNPQLSVWDWRLRYNDKQILQFQNPGYNPQHHPDSWLPRQQPSFMAPGTPSSVWLFSRGSLAPLNQLCPWRNSPSLLAVSSRWLPRPAVSSESLADQEWGFPSHWGACPLPEGLLLPGCLGPQIRLWRRCYLRGRPEGQTGLLASTVSVLREELTRLEELLKKWAPRVTEEPDPALSWPC